MAPGMSPGAHQRRQELNEWEVTPWTATNWEWSDRYDLNQECIGPAIPTALRIPKIKIKSNSLFEINSRFVIF